MKCIPIQVDVASVRQWLDYDPECGTFRWKSSPARNVSAGALAGCVTANGYLQIRINGRSFKAHRLAFALVHGADHLGDCIDHIDGDRLNNRISNLRVVAPRVNSENRRTAAINSTSALLGAFRRSRDRKWVSQIAVRGKQIWLGVFETELEAHKAYIDAKRRLHEGCSI